MLVVCVAAQRGRGPNRFEIEASNNEAKADMEKRHQEELGKLDKVQESIKSLPYGDERIQKVFYREISWKLANFIIKSILGKWTERSKGENTRRTGGGGQETCGRGSKKIGGLFTALICDFTAINDIKSHKLFYWILGFSLQYPLKISDFMHAKFSLGVS